ncbi:MAG TPA: SRPBCC domain-containing protein [Acidimicrobiales bacterium]|nr:SRPBCC domain-containing protein [Acidimicrobiales bacterium]
MPRTDTVYRLVKAPHDHVYAALVDPAALAIWLPPGDMTGAFEHFDARPGGSYRMVLTYPEASIPTGKSAPEKDIVEARFIDIVPGVRVVYTVDFVCDDPAFHGPMTMRWELTPVDGGTRVDVTADDVPDAILAADHIAGMTSSLDQLAQYLSERRFGSAAQAAEWDSRYRESEIAKWSGRPNGRLVAEVADLTPGRALDVGCGEGADAIWLAQRGWAVTAVDISSVAIARAREAARTTGAAVDWVVGDALQVGFPARSFDLVSLQYPALPKAAAEGAVRTLLGTVRPGGLLLAIYHDLDEEHRQHMKSRGVDPADYVGADDLVPLLGEDFTLELWSVEPRLGPPPGAPHIADVVVRARRH